LSFDGSVPFVRVFYEHQLWGAHPLVTMYELRTTLHANHSGDYHDWASLTVYEALPHDFTDQLYDLSYWQSRRAHEAALHRLEAAVPELSDAESADTRDKSYRTLVANVAEQEGKLPSGGPYGSEGDGLRAAGWKRIAEVDWKLALATEQSDLLDNCIRHMKQALAVYQKMVAGFLGSDDDVIHKKANLHWALTQVLSLSVVLGDDFDHASWITAKLSADTDLSHQMPDGRAWAHVSLTELSLLRLADRTLEEHERAEAARDAKNNAQRIVGLVSADAEQVMATRRQLLRYLRWYGDSRFGEALDRLDLGSRPHWEQSGGLLDTARQIVEILGGEHDDSDVGEKNGDGPDRDPVVPEGLEPVLAESSVEAGSARPASVAIDEDAMFDIEMLPAGRSESNPRRQWPQGHRKAPDRPGRRVGQPRVRALRHDPHRLRSHRRCHPLSPGPRDGCDVQRHLVQRLEPTQRFPCSSGGGAVFSGVVGSGEKTPVEPRVHRLGPRDPDSRRRSRRATVATHHAERRYGADAAHSLG
jgi:hypothetical protein